MLILDSSADVSTAVQNLERLERRNVVEKHPNATAAAIILK